MNRNSKQQPGNALRDGLARIKELLGCVDQASLGCQAVQPIRPLEGAILIAALAAAAGFAQESDPPPPPQYPPVQQQQQQYPPVQGQQQYPPPSQQQPYPQQQYPPPSQGQYPQRDQYPPPAQGQYPQSQYPATQYPPPQYGQPPLVPPQQLDQLVEPIALYPDGLLAQVLAAATYSNEIPDAAQWANQHRYLRGEELARAIREDNLMFDPSVEGLLPFPQVLSYMAQYMSWTQQLGNAVLAQRPDVMDAVQRMRQQAYNFGYLRSNEYQRVQVVGPGEIGIYSIDPALYYVPYYNPAVVFFAPRPNFFVGGAIRFGPAITVGASFAPWGWGHVGFGWPTHTLLIDNRPWDRTWVNRGAYVHPYVAPYRRYDGPRVEHHDFHGHEDHGHEDRGHEDHGHDHH